jgi:hypothetical protein
VRVSSNTAKRLAAPPPDMRAALVQWAAERGIDCD